jgi:hypothetical protein
MRELVENGIAVLDHVSDADTHVVLGGRYTNPLILKGRKVLLWKSEDWLTKDIFKMIYEPVIKEYYDALFCVDGMSPQAVVTKVRSYCD